jgi:hypothetical protein
MWFKRNPKFGQNREFSCIVQENFRNRKYENVKKITWTLPQIWRGSRICGSFVPRMNNYWTTDWNEKTGSRKKEVNIENFTSELCCWKSNRQLSLNISKKLLPINVKRDGQSSSNWLFWQLQIIKKPSSVRNKKRPSKTSFARKRAWFWKLLHRQRLTQLDYW